MSDSFDTLPRNHFAAIYADPPWYWKPWAEVADGAGRATVAASRATEKHYDTMKLEDICALPVQTIAADNAVLMMWFTWPLLKSALEVIDAWGFTYKTCAFSWMKADVSTLDMFGDPKDVDMLLGFWTRANSEACLLATRGKPKRLKADVRQGIIEQRRAHSRKPNCVYGRIERLVAGPYLELFARATRPGWTSWGNQVGKFGEAAE